MVAILKASGGRNHSLRLLSSSVARRSADHRSNACGLLAYLRAGQQAASSRKTFRQDVTGRRAADCHLAWPGSQAGRALVPNDTSRSISTGNALVHVGLRWRGSLCSSGQENGAARNRDLHSRPSMRHKQLSTRGRRDSSALSAVTRDWCEREVGLEAARPDR